MIRSASGEVQVVPLEGGANPPAGAVQAVLVPLTPQDGAAIALWLTRG